MRLLHFRSDDPHAHLACSELMLRDAAEGGESLRFWSVPEPALIVGVGGRVADEVDLDACRADGVPVLRRCSGGGTVLVGPGCLCYELILSTDARPELQNVRASYAVLIGALTAALTDVVGEAVRHEGLSDLAWRGCKVGGSAQKRTRGYLLHHGTLLHNMDAALLRRYLRTPPNPPAWRADRTHADFIADLPLTEDALRSAVAAAFNAPVASEPAPPPHALADLLRDRYGNDAWTFRR
jgi:lipoate---protein ligase